MQMKVLLRGRHACSSFCNALICPIFNQFAKKSIVNRVVIELFSHPQGFSKSDHHRSDSAPAVELKPLPKGIICTVFFSCQLCYSANEISH